MKIWIKLLVGSIIGIVLGFVIPVQAQQFFDSLSGVLIGIGRYVLFPFIFFSLGIGTSELRQEKRLGRVYLSSLKYLALSAAVLIVIGTISVLVFPPERIPITVEAGRSFEPVSVLQGLRTIFPRNLFSVFNGSGDFLLPVMVLAFLLGANMDFDRQLTRPIVQIFDSLSRIFYHLNSLVVELFAIAMIIIAAAWVSHVTHADLGMYKQIPHHPGSGRGAGGFRRFPGRLVSPGDQGEPLSMAVRFHRSRYCRTLFRGPVPVTRRAHQARQGEPRGPANGGLRGLSPVRRPGPRGNGNDFLRLFHPYPSIVFQP